MDKMKRYKKKSYFASAMFNVIAKLTHKEIYYIWFYEMCSYYNEKIFQLEE